MRLQGRATIASDEQSSPASPAGLVACARSRRS
jgi:hypothetical protein